MLTAEGMLAAGQDRDLVFRGVWSSLPPALVWAARAAAAAFGLGGSGAGLFHLLGDQEAAGRTAGFLIDALPVLPLIGVVAAELLDALKARCPHASVHDP